MHWTQSFSGSAYIVDKGAIGIGYEKLECLVTFEVPVIARKPSFVYPPSISASARELALSSAKVSMFA